VPGLTSPPPEDSFSNQEKLAFYGLGQQGTYGDNTDKKPGMLGTSSISRCSAPCI
jgi:acyl-CoA-binding protein